MKFLKLAFYCISLWLLFFVVKYEFLQPCQFKFVIKAMAQVEQIQVKHFMKIYIFHRILFKMFSFKFYY